MNFVFKWEKQYLIRERAQQMREILFMPGDNKIHIFKLTFNFLFIAW